VKRAILPSTFIVLPLPQTLFAAVSACLAIIGPSSRRYVARLDAGRGHNIIDIF
jgi:hypothetical protein